MRAYVVDAFTRTAFSGNSAGVVLLDQPADAAWMQAVAAELNHPNTAFVEVSVPAETPKPLRWFTPTAEVDLCGHATMATGHVLGGDQRFDTRSGILICTARADGSVELDFPADEPVAEEPCEELVAGLPGVTLRSVRRGTRDVLVEAGSAAEVRALRPDLAVLARVPGRGVIVTAEGEGDSADVVSRFFAPAVGIPEDPVTGSAHCTLAGWWSERLGGTEFLAEQASSRGGFLRVRLAGDRVLLAGHAVTVLSGELHS
ncbi:PhzF family phenazine biosynthesis protein [Parasphingorhabdus pacifica]